MIFPRPPRGQRPAVCFAALLLSVNLFSAESSAPASLTLENAVHIALTNNDEVRASEQMVKGAEYNVKASYGKYLPQIGIEGTYTRLNAPISVDLNDIRTAVIAADAAALQAIGTNPLIIAGYRNSLNSLLPPFALDVQKEQYYNLSASLVQPLFTGGKLIANTRAKKADLATARSQNRLARNKVVVEAVTSYSRVQLMKDIVAIRKETVDGIQEHQNNAEKLLQAGLISKASKMRADVALAEARREYDKALRDQELAVILLKNVLGGEIESQSLVTPLSMPDGTKDVEQYVAAGTANNPNLQLLASQKKLLEQKYNATAANFLPQVAAFGKYHLYKADLTVFDPEWAAGVTARISLFDGTADMNDMKATKRQIGAVSLFTDNAARMVATAIRKYYHDLQTAREQYESLQVSRQLAEENLRLNRLSFQEGMAPAVDVIDAQLALGQVKATQSKAQSDAFEALVNLLAASGDAVDILTYTVSVEK